MLHQDGLLEETQNALSVTSKETPFRQFDTFTANEEAPLMTSHEAIQIHFFCPSLLSNRVFVEAPQLSDVKLLRTRIIRRSISQDVSLAAKGIHCNTTEAGTNGWSLSVEGAACRRSKSCQSFIRLSKVGSRPVTHYTANLLNAVFTRDGCDSSTFNSVGEEHTSRHAFRAGGFTKLGVSPACANLHSYKLLSIKYQEVSLLHNSEDAFHWVDDDLNKLLINFTDLELGREIGIGSSAMVYEGLYRKYQKVAVKILKAFDGSEGQFSREILVLSSCRHKNILRLVGVCLNSCHRCCIVTKFMERGSLHDFLQRKEKLSPKEILRLAEDIARGMHFLHSRGVIHMDLKSSNILLGDDGAAVIGDPASARFLNENQDLRKDIGTYRWMAPEVFGAVEAGKAVVTPKSDVYSFGILLWELVSCKVPYADYSPVQAAAGVVMNGLRPTIPKDCYPPFKCIIQKCWSQKATDRPSFSQILKMLKIVSTHCSK